MTTSERTAYYQTPSIRNRLTVVILAFAVIAVGMLARTSWIQLIGDPKLENLAKRQFQSKVVMKPRRGLITDQSGEPLAINLETSSLAGNPSKILKSRTTLTLLSRALNITPTQLKKKLSPKRSFLWLDRHISDDKMSRYRKLGIENMPEGLWIVKEMKRVYPHGELAGAILGTVNIDAKGLEGVELWQDILLQGKSESIDGIKDALGRPAFLSNNNSARIQDGKTVELSLDASLQYSVEEVLAGAVARTRSQSGMAIIMDSHTGEILALAQNPSFNPNYKNSPSQFKKIRALTDGYEPGSTLKPLIVASALKKGMKITDALFGHYGQFKIQNRTINEAEAHEKFGYISLKKMLEVSSNIVAAELALKLGGETLHQSLLNLGFAQRTGIGFPGEITGRIPAPTIRGLDVATLGFGQGLLVTPLQMLRAFAALSNGGKLVEPTLLKKTTQLSNSLEPRTESHTKYQTEARTVFSAQVANDVTQALLQVTEAENGTGKKARVPGFRVAGKTGTAQTVDPRTKKYSSSRYIASFIGYAVGTQRPLTILTLLDQPRGIYYASETAAPLFSETLKIATSRFSIPATEIIPIQMSATPAASQIAQVALQELISAEVSESADTHSELNKDGSKEVKDLSPMMPSLGGLTPQESMTLLKAIAPRIRIHGFGLVKRQLPEAGSSLKMGESITLYLGE